jgi:hypothetical protein
VSFVVNIDCQKDEHIDQFKMNNDCGKIRNLVLRFNKDSSEGPRDLGIYACAESLF